MRGDEGAAISDEGLARAARAARLSLARARPALSARRRLWFSQIVFACAGAFAMFALATIDAARAIDLARFLGFGVFSALIAMRLVAAAAALAPPAPGPVKWTGDLPVYTILCPLYREAGMIAAIVERMSRLDYPADKLDIKLVLEADDQPTIAAANRAGLPAHFEVVVVPAGKPRTKPKALNYALAFSRGAFLTIYDAEDAPAPRQLRAALDAFAAGGEDLAVVQAPLLIDNAKQSWLAGQFAAEYAIHFGEMLPLLARLGAPLMLGGTSNHFRTHALAGAGAWDPFNVTEDADLGYRLARDGWRAGMIAPPTWEEAPTRLWPWLRQRTRWIKGHIQTWLVLMRDPPAAWRELGAANFLTMQLMLGGAIVSAFLHGPILAALAWAALSPDFNVTRIDWALATAGYATAWYCALSAAAALRDWRIGAAALTMPLYWPLSSLAAALALLDLLIRPHYWAKTEHGVSARG